MSEPFLSLPIAKGIPEKRARFLFRVRSEKARPGDEQLAATQSHGVLSQKRYMEITGNKVVAALAGTENFNHAEEDDFVISLRTFEGGIERAAETGCISPAYTVLAPSREVEPSFYQYLLKSQVFISHLQTTVTGIRDGKSVKFENFANIVLPHPDLATQKAIADFLDRETARIDQLIEKKQRLAALLGERLAHLVRNLITRGTTDSPELAQTDLYWCPSLPKNWQVRKGFHIGRLVGSTSGEEAKDDGEATVPYIKVADLNACDGDRLVSTKAMFRSQSTFRPQPQDYLVFPKRGAAIFTNKVAIAPANSAIDPNLMGWVIFEGYEPEYFMWVLKTRTLDNLADVSTVPQINNKHIYPERFPVPPTEEQKKIVEEIARVRSLSFAITERNQLSIYRLKEYRAALITAAVTGQIDVSTYGNQGPTDRTLDRIEEEMGG